MKSEIDIFSKFRETSFFKITNFVTKITTERIDSCTYSYQDVTVKDENGKFYWIYGEDTKLPALKSDMVKKMDKSILMDLILNDKFEFYIVNRELKESNLVEPDNEVFEEFIKFMNIPEIDMSPLGIIKRTIEKAKYQTTILNHFEKYVKQDRFFRNRMGDDSLEILKKYYKYYDLEPDTHLLNLFSKL